MEDIEDKDKTIAILRNRNSKWRLDEIQRLEMELAAAQYENKKLREVANLEMIVISYLQYMVTI